MIATGVVSRRSAKCPKTIHDQRYAALVAELRAKRLEQGLNQATVARRLGVGRQWIGKIERRDLRLDVLHFVRLCQVLGVRPERMLRHLTEDESPAEGDSLLRVRRVWAMRVREGCRARKMPRAKFAWVGVQSPQGSHYGRLMAVVDSDYKRLMYNAM